MLYLLAAMAAVTAAVQAAEPATQATIPAAFHGSWREDLADCGRHVESRLEVGPRELRFYESRAEVQSVQVRGPRAIDVTTIAEGEGHVWEDRLTVLLSADGGRLSVQYPEAPYTRQRCPAGQ